MVYGRAETVEREGCAVRDKTVDLREEEENCCPGDKNEKVGQGAKQRVAVVANLQRLDAAGETAGCAGGQCRCFQTRARHNFQRQEHQKNDGNCFPAIHMYLLVK